MRDKKENVLWLCAFAVACNGTQIATPVPPHVTPASQTQTHVPRAVAVARNIDVLVGNGVFDTVHIDDADVYDWREDGYTLLARNGEVVEVHALDWNKIPEKLQPGRGIGLFVARDTPILSANEKGDERVGIAHRGAFLPIVSVTGDWVRVWLPRFGGQGRVNKDALTTVRGTPSDTHYAASFERHIELDSDITLHCGAPVSIIEETAAGMRVAQSVAGVEIVGIAKSSGIFCPHHVRSETVPDGWFVPATFKTRAFASPRSFYLIERDDSDVPTCVKWAYRSGKLEVTRPDRISTDWMKLSDAAKMYKAPLKATSNYDLEGAKAVIEGPDVLTVKYNSSVLHDARGKLVNPGDLGRGEGIGTCGYPMILMVGETPDGLQMIDNAATELGGHAVAYPKEDVVVWYTREAACQEAAARMRTSKTVSFLAHTSATL